MKSRIPNPASANWAFAVVAYALFMSNAGGNLLSPLYEVYRRTWGFDASDITVVYAIYALVLIPGLPIFGALSKRVEAKRILLVAGIFALSGSILALFSSDIFWLGGVRVLQGIGIAMISGVGAKTLVQLVPPAEHDKASLAATATLAGGGAFGVLMAGVVAQFGDEPLRMPFLAHIVLLVPGLLALYGLDLEPRPSGPSPVESTNSAPKSARRAVMTACIAGFTCFAVLGMFLSIAPTIVANAINVHAPIVGAAVASFMLIASSVAQIGARKVPYNVQLSLGLGLLPLGIIGFYLLMASGNLALLLATVVIGGIGHGLIFLGGLELIERISSDANRATLAAIYFASSYAGASIPVIALGFRAKSIGAQDAVAEYAAFVTFGCVLTLALFLWEEAASRGAQSEQ